MNKTRRQQVKEAYVQLQTVQSDLEKIRIDEQDAYDNMPENLQGSDRGQESEEAIDNLGDAICSIEDAIDSLYEVV